MLHFKIWNSKIVFKICTIYVHTKIREGIKQSTLTGLLVHVFWKIDYGQLETIFFFWKPNPNRQMITPNNQT